MDKHGGTHVIRTHECGGNLHIRPESILHWIQDLAEDHASTLGFGYDMCMEQGLAWVEIKLHINILRAPSWKERINITTWSYPLSPVIAGRDFAIQDADGNTIIEIASQWALIDVKRRRPVSLKKHLSWFTEELQRATAPEQNMEDIPSVTAPDIETSHTAEYHTVDFNQHVNNSYYLLWALDSLPYEYQGKPIKQIRIDFCRESMPGDEIKTCGKLMETHALFTLCHGETERARVKIVW